MQSQITTPDWHFASHQPGGPVYNPLGGEHFNQGAVGDGDWEAGESLVRESIQNSIDARSGSEPVHVAFHVSPPSGLTSQSAEAWFGSLWPHLRSAQCKLRGLPERPMVGGYLVVEDFGTNGLEGDTRQWSMPRAGEDNDFFNFFRAEGLSGKGESRGGSWGEGKSVFSRCSKINTFLAVSVRRRDRSIVAIGKSILWHHFLGLDEFRAVGQYGLRPDPLSDLVLPSDSEEVLRQLSADFKLRRPLGLIADEEAEPGLSIIVPYSHRDVTARSILTMVVREYFEPILAGRLCVTVTGDGLGRGSVRLDADSVLQEAEAICKPELVRLLRLADWTRIEGRRSLVEIGEVQPGQAPRWDESLIPSNFSRFQELCSRFEKGDPVAVRVPLHVQMSGQSPRRSYFDVYLRKDLEGDGYRPLFVRAGGVIPNARERALKNRSLLSIVMVEHGPLAAMLRAAEPPAHTTWSHETQNFQGLYEFGKATIAFVTGAPGFIADILARARVERDDYSLAAFFPEPDNDGRESENGPDKLRKDVTIEIVDPPPARPKPFRIDQSPGGFRVQRDNPNNTPLPALLEVKVAYDTSRGNAFRKYNAADFDLAKMTRRASGVTEESCGHNLLVLVPKNDAFDIAVDGFDPNRDLIVHVRTAATVDPEGGDS